MPIRSGARSWRLAGSCRRRGHGSRSCSAVVNGPTAARRSNTSALQRGGAEPTGERRPGVGPLLRDAPGGERVLHAREPAAGRRRRARPACARSARSDARARGRRARACAPPRGRGFDRSGSSAVAAAAICSTAGAISAATRAVEVGGARDALAAVLGSRATQLGLRARDVVGAEAELRQTPPRVRVETAKARARDDQRHRQAESARRAAPAARSSSPPPGRRRRPPSAAACPARSAAAAPRSRSGADRARARRRSPASEKRRRRRRPAASVPDDARRRGRRSSR